jgi:holliday junction DNA helicase RuvA
MIALLQGCVLDINAETFILDVSGVGYEISCTHQTLADVQNLVGQDKKVKVWIYSHIREDAFQLFGFLNKTEKEFFTQLLKVNGVGPKSALSLLAGAPVQQIIDWVEEGNAKALSALPKVGKKTSEQIILTLQGKLVRVVTESKKIKSKINLNETHKKISSALVNLGYKNQIVEEFVSGLEPQINLEEGIRQGLKRLSGQVL